ncbi:hypothetical protein [Microviridae sp.]|nr:hypothetical protein [Microviridae sp.]
MTAMTDCMPLREKVAELKKKHPHLNRKKPRRYSQDYREVKANLNNPNSLLISRYLVPLDHDPRTVLERKLVLKVMRECASQGIPLIGGIVWSDGTVNCEFVHYDFLSDLTLMEGRYLRRVVKEMGIKIEAPVFDTLNWLRFSLA